jgi:hypothetical protein
VATGAGSYTLLASVASLSLDFCIGQHIPLALPGICCNDPSLNKLHTEIGMRTRSGSLAFWLCCILASPLGVCGATVAADAQGYDIVIAGAGTGGVSAAIQAARMGANVALLEESDWIGGQMSAAAVSTMDEGNNLTPPSGLYREFLARMDAHYIALHKSVGTCYWQSGTHCFEPSATRSILNEMIAETNTGRGAKKSGHITLLLQDRVTRVLTSGGTVTGVVTQKGKTLQSKVLIDATEYGDVLPLTPARYRSGHSIGPNHQDCTQDLTYTMVIKKYPGGVPSGLMMQHTPPEYDKYLPTLRAQWRPDGNDKTRKLPVNFAVHNAYRGLPDSSNPELYVATESKQITRTVLNWFNDFQTNTDIFDRSQRKLILCGAKLKTLANLYYLQHEMGETLWSVANDEGYDTELNRKDNSCPNIPAEFKAIENNFPALPYIRESNRLIGEYTLTGGDVRREKQGGISVIGFHDSIAVGDYADDLHACNAPGDMEIELEHLSDRAPGFRSGPFEVPLRSLIPEKVDGLLAAEKNISESRLANGATRLQPITMLTGQAAGTLAALAVEKGVQPRAVPAGQVQIALLKSGSILARKPMPDLPMGTRLWQAAQFAVANQWIDARSGFEPKGAITRSQAADLLARAFALTPLGSIDDNEDATYEKARDDKATYEDVPLYSDMSPAVEAWHATGAVPGCKQASARFCPDAPLTTGEFITTVAALNGKRQAAKANDSASLHIGVVGNDNDPLTRLDAVLILYNCAQ